VETPDSWRVTGAYRLSDWLTVGPQQRSQRPRALARRAAGENTAPDTERTKEMFRTVNREKVKQLKPNTRTVVFTILWLVLLGAAILFIAFVGHV
jgi:hypothetical protein